VERGNWSMMEPVTLPGWNLLEEADRQEALAYLARPSGVSLAMHFLECSSGDGCED